MKKSLFFLFLFLAMAGLRAQTLSACDPPGCLTASLHSPAWPNVLLNWKAPADTGGRDLTWSSFESDVLPSLEGYESFTAVVRFGSAELAEVEGQYLTAVSFVPKMPQVSLYYNTCQYSVQVWQGGSCDSASNTFSPGSLVIDIPVVQELHLNAVNTVDLNTMVAVDPEAELWIGVHCVSMGGSPMWVSGNGQAEGKGNLIFQNDSAWGTLTSAGVAAECNWDISGRFKDASHAISGYVVIRNGEEVATASPAAVSYLDTVESGVYTYGVSARYADGCTSAPAYANVIMYDDWCSSCSDSIFVVGDETATSYGYPLNTYYNYSYTQQMYKASELSGLEGAIGCVAFQYIHSLPQAKGPVRIYMGNTPRTSFADGRWMPVEDMQIVYEGSILFDTGMTGNWVNIPLNLPFEYDTAGSLVVAFLNNSGSYVTGSDETFNVHSAENMVMYANRDGSPYNPEVEVISGATASRRNNIRFMAGEPLSCGSPLSVSVNDVTSESAELSWNVFGEPGNYEVKVVPEGILIDDVEAENVEGDAYSAGGLLPSTSYTVYVRTVCPSGYSCWVSKDFHTRCTPLEELPLTEDFDSYSAGPSAVPECWEAGGTDPGYPSITSEKAHSGNNSFLFKSSFDDYSYVCLRALPDGYPVDALHLRFSAMACQGNDGHLQVGVMTDPGDPSTFTPVKIFDRLSFEALGVWESKDVYFNTYTGNGSYIAIMAPKGYPSAVYVDDLVLKVRSGCSIARNLAVDHIAGTSALVSWQPGELHDGTESYTVEYRAAGGDEWLTLQTAETYAMLSQLTPQTAYELRLFSTCADGGSDTLDASFATLCLAGGELQTGNGSLLNDCLPVRAYYKYSYTQQLFLADELNGEGDLDSLAFEVVNNSYNSDTIQRAIRVFIGNTDISDLTPETAVSSDSQTLVYKGGYKFADGWNVIPFDSTFQYTGGNIVLTVVDSTGSYIYGLNFKSHNPGISSVKASNDNVGYDPAVPSAAGLVSDPQRNNVKFYFPCTSGGICCMPNLIVGALTPTGAELHWAPGNGETAWELDYRMASDSAWTPLGQQTATVYMLDYLLPNTGYEARLKSLCGTDESSAFRTVRFTTPCEPVDALPLSENFDLSEDLPDCWHALSNPGSDYPYVGETQSLSGSRSLALNGSNYNSGYTVAVMPELGEEVKMDSLLIAFNTYVNDNSCRLEMGIMTDPDDYTTFHPLCTSPSGAANVWSLTEYMTTGYTGQGRHIAFRMPVGKTGTAYLDDVSVMYISLCPHVTDLAVSAVGPSQVTLTWTPGGEESQWQVAVAPGNAADPDTCTAYEVYAPTFTADSLEPNAPYSVYVRAICDDEYSTWFGPVTFKTLCLAETVPYSHDFESDEPYDMMSSDEPVFPECWTKINRSADPYVNFIPYVTNESGHSGNQSLAVVSYVADGSTDSYAVLPLFDTEANPISTLQMSFYAATGDVGWGIGKGKIVVGVMEDIMDENSFVAVQTFDITSSDYEVFEVPFAAYEGNGAYIALKFPVPADEMDYYYFFVDDIYVEPIPDCPRPRDVSVTGSTLTSLTIDWNEIGSAEEWTVQYGAHGFNPETEGIALDAAEHPFEITGLTEATAYDFYVKGICSDSETSNWSDVLTANTECDVFQAPYQEDFEHSGEMPICWSQEHVSGSANWTIGQGDAANIDTAHGGSYNAYFYNNDYTSPSTVKLVSPVLDLSDVTAPILRYWYANEAFWYADVMAVYYRTSSSDEWVQLKNYELETFSWTADSVELPNPSATYQIAFEASGTGFGLGVIIDDILIESMSGGDTAGGDTAVCDVPTGLHAAATATDATVGWSETGSFEVACRVADGGDWPAPDGVTDNTYTFTGLTPATAYEWHVRQVCGEELTSDWAEGTFTTEEEEQPEPCLTPTALAVSDITPSTAVLSWQQEGEVDGWTVNYRRAGDDWTTTEIDENPYTLVDLLGNTDYEVRLRANCADGQYSEYCDIVPFHTLSGDGIGSFGGSGFVLCPNPASTYVDVRFSDGMTADEVRVYDVYGRLLMSSAVTGNQVRLDLSGLSGGLYFVRAVAGSGTVNRSFVKK